MYFVTRPMKSSYWKMLVKNVKGGDTKKVAPLCGVDEDPLHLPGEEEQVVQQEEQEVTPADGQA
jgi:hypothetical protein